MSEALDGPRIRALRERAGWTQAQLADKVHVAARTVGAWERGEAEPRGRMRRELQEVFAAENGHTENGHRADPPPPQTAPTLADATDTELALELLRRAARRDARREQVEDLKDRLSIAERAHDVIPWDESRAARS
jgi:transcriptional regulator with XRE-family HTH domain